MTSFAAPMLASLLGLAAAGFFAGSAQAQSLKQQTAGTWTLVSVTVEGPEKSEPYGPAPHGVMFLDAGGHFSVSLVRDGVPKFVSNNRTKGTAEVSTISARTVSMRPTSRSPSRSRRAAIRTSPA